MNAVIAALISQIHTSASCAKNILYFCIKVHIFLNWLNLMWSYITVINRAVALEQIQVFLSSLLALFQVLIAVFLHALCVCASDEMGALVQVAASRQRDEGRLISGSLRCLWSCSIFHCPPTERLSGQQRKNDTIIFWLIWADYIIAVVVREHEMIGF